MSRSFGPALLSVLLGGALLSGCMAGELNGSPAEGAGEVEEPAREALVAGGTAAGVIPIGLPARELVGLFEDSGGTWMQSSAVPWDVRYRYFTKGWVNNWGFGAYDGSWGLGYMRECDAQRFIPAIQYYQMNGEAGGSESAFLQKVKNATTMKGYFGDFKLLMQRAKEFGKPVLVLVEADGFGFLEQQAGGNGATYAAVKDTGLADLAALPNTVAGWGLAFLQLRKAAGASNVVLGMHISAWASGNDVAYAQAGASLQPEVDKVYAFLAPFGLSSNVTGATWDVLVGDPLDRDSDFYRLTQGQDRWWDASDTAPLTTKSFNHYAEWLRLWNVKASRRWVLWQVPLGNSNHRDVNNDGTARAGYKDNRPEYFFANGTAHLAKFADVGVIALLFGAGAGGQSSYQNDTFTDGQLFMKSRAGAILKAGSVALGSGTGAGGGGGSTGAGGAGGTTTPSDPAQYGFEAGAQAWVSGGAPITAVASSTARAFAGTRALSVTFGGTAGGTRTVAVASPAAGAGKPVTFHVWFPSGSPVTSIQPFVQQGSAGGWTWTGTWRAASSLTAGAWNTITVVVPTNAVTPLSQLGVELATSAAWSGTVYVDSVAW